MQRIKKIVGAVIALVLLASAFAFHSGSTNTQRTHSNPASLIADGTQQDGGGTDPHVGG